MLFSVEWVPVGRSVGGAGGCGVLCLPSRARPFYKPESKSLRAPHWRPGGRPRPETGCFGLKHAEGRQHGLRRERRGKEKR